MRRREKIFQKWITWKIYGFLKVSFAKIIRHGVFIAFAIYLFQVASPWIHSLTSVAEWKEKNLSRRKRFKKWAHDNKKIKQQKQRNTKTKGGKKAVAAANGNRQQDAKRIRQTFSHIMLMLCTPAHLPINDSQHNMRHSHKFLCFHAIQTHFL